MSDVGWGLLRLSLAWLGCRFGVEFELLVYDKFVNFGSYSLVMWCQPRCLL